jgi:hypothetical protein
MAQRVACCFEIEIPCAVSPRPKAAAAAPARVCSRARKRPSDSAVVRRRCSHCYQLETAGVALSATADTASRLVGCSSLGSRSLLVGIGSTLGCPKFERRYGRTSAASQAGASVSKDGIPRRRQRETKVGSNPRRLVRLVGRTDGWRPKDQGPLSLWSLGPRLLNVKPKKIA